MGIWKKYSDKLYLKQWSIGFAKCNMEELIRNKKNSLPIQWLSPESNKFSYADPFIFRTDDGKLHVLFESVSTVDLDGKITLMTIDNQCNPVSQKTLLETEAHLSYPFVYKENGKIYVFPENAFSGSLYCYEFDPVNNTLINKKEVINLPVVDATITKYEGKYWLFGTMVGKQRNSELHIFYSNSLTGPYTAHQGNPVKRDLYSARPAGNLVIVDGNLYRPAQNCSSYYGESISINKITKLNTTQFEEEEYFTIRANRKDQFNYGIHTINACGDTIIVDGQKRYFQPVQQLTRKLRSFF
jgi:hypothetical protein